MGRGTWVAQSVKRPTLGFGSGRDLRVVRWSPASGSALSRESACDSLSPPLSLPTTHALSQINLFFFLKKEMGVCLGGTRTATFSPMILRFVNLLSIHVIPCLLEW